MSWLDFVALVLAAGAIVDVWFNGSIFATWFATAQAYADGSPGRLRDKFWELITCPYCLSFHVPVWLLASWWLWSYFLPDVPDLVGGGIYALAITRTSYLLNGFLPARLQYDRERLTLGDPDDGRNPPSTHV